VERYHQDPPIFKTRIRSTSLSRRSMLVAIRSNSVTDRKESIYCQLIYGLLVLAGKHGSVLEQALVQFQRSPPSYAVFQVAAISQFKAVAV